MSRACAAVSIALVPTICVTAGVAGVAGQTKLIASDRETNDLFGFSVAVSGATAVVGAYGEDQSEPSTGSAYVFDLTTGLQVAKLTAGDPADSDFFGFSVAVAGTTALIGAHGDDHSGLEDAGSAYVFDLTTGQQVAKLTADDADESDLFGWSVAISGTTAVVGAHGDNHSGFQNAGSAYLFDLTTGQQVAKLTASDADDAALFGVSVAISGTIAVVGARDDDPSGVFRAGSAYVFDLVTGQQVAKLTAGDGDRNDLFGSSVAVSGTTAVVGAPDHDQSGITRAGAAYVFDLVTGQQVAKLTARDAAGLDFFGRSVAIEGTTALVGASHDDHSGLSSSGSAYVFDLTTGRQVAKLTASDADEFDLFGRGVAVSGTTAVVGAHADDHGGVHNAGSAYAFDLADLRECVADFAEPFGILDLADITAFVTAFTSQDPLADLEPDGVFDLSDITAFVETFSAGCP